MSVLVEAKELKKYFDTKSGQLHAVDGINFQIEEGRTLGVVGESGCGKSTLGRTILHLLESTDGQLFFEGKDVTKLDKEGLKALRRQAQMIFQDPYSSLNPRMTVSQLIAEPLKIEKQLSKADVEKKVLELMDTVGLARRLFHTYPHELDGGRRQRIGVAKALAVNPKFIVCDEPVSALDVSIQAQILNLLKDLQEERGLTYMFITHDLSVVKYISHDIMVMYLGQMVEKGPAKEIFDTTIHPYTKALFSALPQPSIHNRQERILLKGELSSPINPKPGCRFAKRCIYAKDICFAESPALEEYEPNHMVACHFAHEINK
ncbi:ABC transporter ATP-binding protein [Hominifimenecus sp. rT4P-3]|uniref:ABC transporter ATP-binding protein n=1 Tax=Hominifimenecus sp. rT4P-3 TaxID=3242979 RepID=UPI003DA2B1A7